MKQVGNASSREVIWITGASSGIGRKLALKVAQAGHNVIASARNREQLEQLATQCAGITPLAFDVTQASEMAVIRSQLMKISPYLNRVILNAGHCEYLTFPNPDWDMVRRVMAVNLQGTVNCVELALPLLRRCRERAHIIGIASQVTGAPFPKAEAYGASKAALQYFLQSLRLDLAVENIDVTVVNPGFIDTPMTRQNDFDMPFLMDADRAAERIIEHAFARPRSYTFPRRLYWLLKLSALFPRWWQKSVAPPQESQL